MTVSNVAFGDGDDDPGNAWVAAVEPSRVVWQAPSGGALDWGRLDNFRMDVDAPPVASGALLSPLLAGSDLAAPTLAPAAAPAVVPALPAPLLALALAALCLLAAALAPVVRGRRGRTR